MPSPFPGMNPFLEQEDVWHDFHEKIIPAIVERLVLQVRPNDIVKVDERLYVHELPPDPGRYFGRADVSVGEPSETPASRPIGTAILAAPFEVWLPAQDVEPLAFVEIQDRLNRELISVIEVLSPTNKQSGSGREQYLARREELLESRVHLVEIDLLRGGKPMPVTEKPDRVYSYSILVSRGEDRPRAGFWPVGLREPLPIIPVPLRAPEGDAQLDLQDVLHRVYDASGYEDYIYSGTPDPPLSADELQWAGSLLQR
jgi:Protein of unknown function (DUF4058)